MAIDWNVKNAVNRDVERQHLNKILADIRASVDALNKSASTPASDIESTVGKMVDNNTENGINVTYNAAKKVLDFVITDFTITLTGDVTGSGTVSRLGNVTISTEVDDSIGIEEAPTDGLPYWRVAGDWQYVGVALESLANMSGTGFTVIRSNDGWITREFEVVAGELVVTNADGNDGNPTFGLADVVDSNTGTLQGTTVDGKGRVTGTTDATITAGAGIDVVNGNAAAGPPTISHADTSSVANVSSDNSNGVVIQDIAFTFDTFGHVQTISVGTVDLDTRYAPSSILTSTITDGDTTHAPDGNSVFDALELKFDKVGGTITGNVTLDGGFLNIDRTGDAALAQILVSADAGQSAYHIFRTAGANRWLFGKLNDAESGGDAGSDFIIVRCLDAGPQITALRIDRATGAVWAGVDNAQNLGAPALRWGNVYGTQFRPGTGASIWTSGTGTPEGVVTASIGSLYTRTDGGAGTTLYVKESGAGNTGWIAK